ncbi:phage terminase, endonuclease subunit [Trabulsiella guamensis ATCC 49490]|uniref:Phage terminase, endonuclease subunit n=1 Tax=Trabulsiella guamensis ATCC 49490 TaxID=1005994 RepID=A0A084ZPS0_9ENTR|nr:phage terminase small subunit [Trabulsiella guamensis]KFB99464.1 phage terminase, endonuclease subunit [Trabulsiella guamensis ATCC 49490]
MLTPAQHHFQKVMAKRRGQHAEETLVQRTAHEQIMHTLRLAQSRLKGIQSNAAKAEIKKELMPEFTGWIDGTIDGDSGRQDEVITTMMVWAIDCGDTAQALRLGEYVVRHNLNMPDNFGRSAATVLTEELCAPVLTLAVTDPDADLSEFIAPLDELKTIVAGSDMPDQVRAKLCKAAAFVRRASTDPEVWGDALKLFREAMHLDKNAGVKREIATLLRMLKKVPGVPADAATDNGTAATATKAVTGAAGKRTTKGKAAKAKGSRRTATKKPGSAAGQEQS